MRSSIVARIGGLAPWLAAAGLSCVGPRANESGARPGTDALRVAAFPDGARVTDTRLSLAAVEVPGAELDEVDFSVDGQPVATRRGSPWGWGKDGAPVRDAGEMSFGPHTVRIEAKTKRGASLARELHVTYVPSRKRVPSYATDVAPIFHAHCASCHDHGLARDLASYDRLRALTPRLRSSIREARMPPDFAIDPEAAAIFVAWCDGNTPP